MVSRSSGRNCSIKLFLEVFLVVFLTSIAGPVFIFFFLYLFFYTQFYWIPLLYLAWMIYDRDSRHVGNKGYSAKGWQLWKNFVSYFPMKLVKTTDLDPTDKYLFISVPHGVLSLSTLIGFGTSALDFEKIFPGLTAHYVIQSVSFWFPIVRDMLIHSGNISSSEESLDRVLSSSKGGDATCLVVGGASELIYAAPGCYKTLIKKRKGFARIALKHGVSLVPVISFGETDLYDPLDHLHWPWYKWFAVKVHNLCGFYPAFPFGKTFGIPHQRPVSLVVGAPMKVTRVSEPTSEQIEQVKKEFIEMLNDLFEKHKHKYVKEPENTFLEIV